ncbi:hypothetical protein IC582_024424 [Cucumis melo]
MVLLIDEFVHFSFIVVKFSRRRRGIASERESSDFVHRHHGTVCRERERERERESINLV